MGKYKWSRVPIEDGIRIHEILELAKGHEFDLATMYIEADFEQDNCAVDQIQIYLVGRGKYEEKI